MSGSGLTRRELLRWGVLLSTTAVPGFVRLGQSNAARASGALADDEAPSFLVLVFDAFSAHHASFLGYERETTPNLAQFAKRSTVYRNHYAAGNFTSSGTASLLTGTYPWSHRALHLHSEVLEDVAGRNILAALPSAYATLGYSHNLLVSALFEQFRASMDIYKRTRELCLVDNEYADRLFPGDYNTAFQAEWQLLRGGKYAPSGLVVSLVDRVHRRLDKRRLVGEYGDRFPRGIPNLHSLFFVLEDAVDWMVEELPRLPRPFFAYVHVIPPHEPYYARRDFVGAFDDGWSPAEKPEGQHSGGVSKEQLDRERRHYDEFLAYADAEFGRLQDQLAGAGLFDDTYLMVTADHGELFERGIRGHVTPALYDPVIRVPLVVAAPGQLDGREVRVPTSCVDVLPTVLTLAGGEVPAWAEGQVLPGLTDAAADSDAAGREVYAVEAKSNPKLAPLEKVSVALRREEHKLVRYGTGADASYELYDLANDPEEREDLYADRPRVARELQRRLDGRLEAVNRPYVA